jgi:predicted RNA-binding protein with PUA-like domain
MNRHWLVKSEPFKYSFEQLVREGRTHWDGVRNFEARNNLRAMARGDLLLFYHSNEGLAVVGVARVAREAYPDPTAPGEDWSVVDVEPVAPLPEPVPLATIRATPVLASMALLRRSRLSVTPVTPAEFDAVVRLGKAEPGALAAAADPFAPSARSARSARSAATDRSARAAGDEDEGESRPAGPPRPTVAGRGEAKRAAPAGTKRAAAGRGGAKKVAPAGTKRAAAAKAPAPQGRAPSGGPAGRARSVGARGATKATPRAGRGR